MLVLCEANVGSGIPRYAWRFGEGEETRYSPLKIGSEYRVYGIKFRSNGADYLLYPAIHDSDWGHGPTWMPGSLFKILDSSLPPWRLCMTDQEADYRPLFTQYDIIALIGYEELVRNPSHYDGILDRDRDEIQKFFVEKSKIDQWLQDNC